ncbi:MAG: polysaccharide pyruvyl transferase family protein [Cyanobacteria bacterium P01_F01_bin.86]
MNVGLINTYSTQNLGDAAIYSAIAEMLPEGRLLASFNDSQMRLIPGLRMADLQVQSLENCDAYISVGGDIFNNARKYLATRKFLQNIRQLWHSPKSTFLFGQSIPRSCQGLSFGLLALTLRNLASVCVRDQESYYRLQQAGVQALLSYDTAFALRGSEAGLQVAQRLFDAIEVDPSTAVCLSVRAFDTMYMRQPDVCFQQVVKLCQALSQRGHRPVVLVQSQASKGEDDRAIAARIRQHVPTLGVFNPFVQDPQVPDWDVAMGALSLCRTIVGVRYHTAVLSLASGRCPFNLYYSNKGQDLTERLGIPGCSLETLDLEVHIPQIEQTIDHSFDHDTLRQQVYADFTTCYKHTLTTSLVSYDQPTHAVSR